MTLLNGRLFVSFVVRVAEEQQRQEAGRNTCTEVGQIC
jgi:hypothetical protein